MVFSKSVIVTGGTVNLGYEAALQIATTHPDWLVVVSSRSDKENAAETINKASGHDNTVFFPLDLSSLESVRGFAERWGEDQKPPIQSLVLNAGLQFPGDLTRTKEGIEATFAVNHVGHAFLFHLLTPYFAKHARIVLTASGTHDPSQKTGMPDAKYNTAQDLADPPESMVHIPGRARYTSSKLANIMWMYALDRRLAQQNGDSHVTVTAFDPGLMPGTGLAREAGGVQRFVWNSVLPRIIPFLRVAISKNIHTTKESGAALAHLAIADDVQGATGKYYEGLREIPSSKDSYDEKKQEDLWRWTVDYIARDESERVRFDRVF